MNFENAVYSLVFELIKRWQHQPSPKHVRYLLKSMAELRLSEAEKMCILHGLRDDLRNDGRGCRDYRILEVETDVVSNTSGSARVRLANSDILVGVKAELDSPSPDRPNCGRLEFFVDCSANATPEFEGRGGEELATEVSSTLSRAYTSPSCLDLSTLSVVPGQQCWLLYVDVLILECSGNLFDAVSFAVKSALYNTRIPKVNIVVEEGQTEIELSDDPYDVQRLDVSGAPILVTVAQIGNHYVVDPTMEEEACSRSNIIMGVSEQGSFLCLRKAGSGSVHPETLFDILETGNQVGQLLNKELMTQLHKEEALGHTKQKKGFLG